MSHFCVLVFTKPGGKNVEELLAPFNENIEYKPYVEYTRDQAIEKVRKDIEKYKNDVYAEYLADPKKYEEEWSHRPQHINYVKNIFPQKLKWTDNECYDYEARRYEPEMIAENGDLLSTHNLKSRWNWYTIGGRWDRLLKTKYGISDNIAYVSEVDWNETIPFAFITPDGEWHENGKMNWFGIVTDEKKESDWETEFMEFVQSLGSNVVATVVDCRI